MIRISDRDKRLFDLLTRYEIIGSKQIRKLLFNEIPETNFFRRMRVLENAKMIRRIGPMTDHSYAWVFALEVELNFKNRLRYQELFKRYLKMDGLYAIWYVVPNKSMGDRVLREWEAFFEKFRGQYRRKILCYTELDSFLLDPREALIHDHQGEVKICDWWRLPVVQCSEKITDHSHDQSLIDGMGKKTEAA
jgi:hypothetical protein